MGHRESKFDGRKNRRRPERDIDDWERSSDVKERRRSHRHQRHAQLSRLAERLDLIEDSLDDELDLEQAPIRDGAANLRRKKRRMRGRLQEMGGHDDDRWQDSVKDFERDWKELEEDWDDLSKKLEDSD